MIRTRARYGALSRAGEGGNLVAASINAMVSNACPGYGSAREACIRGSLIVGNGQRSQSTLEREIRIDEEETAGKA